MGGAPRLTSVSAIANSSVSSSNSESNIRKASEADSCEGWVDGPDEMADSVRA